MRNDTVYRPHPCKKAAEAAFAYAAALRARGLFHAVTLAEFLDATRSVNDLLLARIERMAGRAHFDVKLVLAQRGTGYKRAAARAGHSDVFVIGVNAGFHGNSLMS
jgi:hypothetical protein